MFWILKPFEFLPLPLCLYLIEVKVSNFLRSTILSICLRLRPAFGMVRVVWFSCGLCGFQWPVMLPLVLVTKSVRIFITHTCGDKARKFEGNLPNTWSEQGGVCNNHHWQSWLVSMIKNIQRDLERLEQMTKRGNVLSIHVFHAISLRLCSH